MGTHPNTCKEIGPHFERELGLNVRVRVCLGTDFWPKARDLHSPPVIDRVLGEDSDPELVDVYTAVERKPHMQE